MEPALQRRRGVRGHRRPASRWQEHPAAPAGRPDGDSPSAPAAPAAPAGDRLRRSSGPCTGDAPWQRSLANRLAATGGGGVERSGRHYQQLWWAPAPSRETKVCSSGSGAELPKLMPLSPGPRGLWAISPVWLCRWNSAASPGDPPRRRTTRPPPARAGQPAEPKRHWLWWPRSSRASCTDQKHIGARLGRPDVVDLCLPPTATQSTAKRSDSAFGAISQGRRRPATLTHCGSYCPSGILLLAFRSRVVRCWFLGP